GETTDYYRRIKERTAKTRINEILTSSARSVAQLRVNNPANFDQLTTDTADYVSYGDGSHFYPPSTITTFPLAPSVRALQSSRTRANLPNSVSSNSSKNTSSITVPRLPSISPLSSPDRHLFDLYQQQVDYYNNRHFQEQLNDQSDSNELLLPSVNSSIFSSPTLTSSYVGENSQQSLTKKVSETAVSTNDPITDDVMEGSGGDEVEQEQLIQPETSDGTASEELVPQERISPHSQPVFEEDVVCIEESSTAPIIDRKPFVQLVLSNKPHLYTNEHSKKKCDLGSN
ncbi:unnamed protein product, partial [Didymodactylos carnosus]